MHIDNSSEHTQNKTILLLSVMMFLEFFIWGAWYVTMGTYLGKNLQADGLQIGSAYATMSIAAMIAPFFVGLVADRYFAAQKIFGLLHLVGAALLFYLSTLDNFASFYPFLLIYMILYMPTLSLANAISFRQMADPTLEFPKVRVWGTIGWIVAGLLIGYWFLWESKDMLVNTYKMAAVAALGLGLFSFILPQTPPLKGRDQTVSVKEILGLDAIALLKKPSYLIFFVSSILLCIPLAFYYNFTNQFLTEAGVINAAGKMTFGQMSEIVFMLLIPVFFTRLGVKKMLLIGMTAWVLRYICFAYGDSGSAFWMFFLGIVLHGICYDFFFVTGQIYTDQLAGEKFKNAAQGLITFATLGVGMFIGSQLISGQVVEHYVTATGHNWTGIWLVPAGIAAGVFLLFLLLFKENKQD
jgi:nucleoside transporter